MYLVTVDTGMCEGCEECMVICPQDVFVMDGNGKADPANSSECIFCESCTSVCPTGAITIAEV